MPVFHVEPAQPRSSSSTCSGPGVGGDVEVAGTPAPPGLRAASSASRTEPPTRCASNPAAVKRSPSSVSTGERSTSSRTVCWTAGGTGCRTEGSGALSDTTSQGSAPATPGRLRAPGGSFLPAMLPELSPDARYPPGMAGTGGRGRPGRRLRRVDETSAGGLVVADDGVTGPRAALIGRTDRRGRLLWSLPKGHIEEGETPEDTAVREVAEETGIIGEVVAPLGIIDFWFVADGRRVHKTVHHFLLRAIGGALSDADIEVTEVAWVPLDELSGRLAYADERALVERAPALLADTA